MKKLVASARRIGITLATLALLHASARADQELATDRPDFTETSWTVGSRTLQLETGFTLAQPADGSPHEVSAPELLMRVGIASRVEARLGFDRQWRDAAGLRNEGSLGAKIQLLDASSPLGLALIPAVAWPLWTDESDGFDDRARVAEVALAWSGGLAEPWSIGGMVGSELASDPVHQATVSIGRALGEDMGTFFEWAVEFAEGEAGHLLHHGYTFGLGRDAQLDFHLGFGLTDPAPDFFFGMGLGLRR